MIEINLLPPQYRPVERTPLPLFLSFVGGIVLVGAALLFYVALVKSTSTLMSERESAATKCGKLEKIANEADRLEKEVKEAGARIDTLFMISQSKIFWSRKLDQLVIVRPASIWLDSITLTEGKKEEPGVLVLGCNSRGGDFAKVEAFLIMLRKDDNFIYNFQDAYSLGVDRVDPGEEFKEREIVKFQVNLPIKPPEGKKKK
jgi:Tfp pilus assembly protein PilN